MQYKSNAMQDLFTRGWFTRTWTIQEVALASAPLVMCGEKTILWGNLMGGFDVAYKREAIDTTRFARNAVQCIEILWMCLLEKSWDDNDAWFYKLALTLFSAGSKGETIQRFRVFKEACIRTLLVLAVSMAIDRFNRGSWRLRNNACRSWTLMIYNSAHFNFWNGLRC